MIAVLIAVAIAFLLSVFGTPFLIRYPARARHRPADPRRRPDRAPARAKAGTPTMGGIAIVVARGPRLPRRAHPHRGDQVRRHRRSTLLVPDPRAGDRRLRRRLPRRRRGRNLGLRKRGKTGGKLDRRGRVRAARARSSSTSRRTSRSPAPLDLDLGAVGWFIWAIVVIYATTNAVNITDGLDGLRRRVGRRSCSPRS